MYALNSGTSIMKILFLLSVSCIVLATDVSAKDVSFGYDDWIEVRSTRAVESAPVTDRRWETFETINTTHLSFSERPLHTLSFSVYVKSYIHFNFQCNNFERNRTVREDPGNNTNKWLSYTILSKDKKLFLLENNHISKKKNNCSPSQLIVQSEVPTLWKIHNYTYRMARTITNNKPTVINISHSSNGIRYVALYVLLEKNCFLEVVINRNEKHIINPTNQNSTLVPVWYTHLIKVEPNEDMELRIYRNHTENKVHGYWAFDLQAYDEENSQAPRTAVNNMVPYIFVTFCLLYVMFGVIS